MATTTNPLGPTIRTIPGIGTFAAPAPLGGPVGGVTWAGSVPTPGYVSPFTQGGIKDIANNTGTAANAALRRFRSTGNVGATQGGFNRQFGFGGGRGAGGFPRGQTFRLPSGQRAMYDDRGNIQAVNGRINARAGLSPATGRGLQEFYQNNAVDAQGNLVPGQWGRMQLRMERDKGLTDTANAMSLPSTSTRAAGAASNSGLTFNQGLNAFIPNWLQPSPTIPFRAKGGKTNAIQPYIVNEEGPEAYQPKGGKPMIIPGPMQMFIPPKDGKIIPHNKTMKMAKEGKVLPPVHRQNGGMVVGPRFGSFMPNSSLLPTGFGNPVMSNVSTGMNAGMGGNGMSFGYSTPFAPPQFRATGGRVRGSGVPMRQPFYAPSVFGGGQSLPPWLKWYQSGGNWLGPRASSQTQQARTASSYEELFQRGLNAGIDMSRAPQTLSGLQRYLSMGRRSALGAQAAARETRRVAQEREEGRIADEAWRQRQFPGQFNVNPDGTRDIILNGVQVGTSTNAPRTQVGMFANEFGEMLPWSVPAGSWQTTWMQDRLLSEAQDRSRRSRSGQPITEAQYSVIDEFIP